MNKLFCVSCGFKILYEVSKPKFCSSCGKGIGSVSSASVPEEARKEEEPQLDVNINKLKRDIVVEASSDKTSLQDLWSSVSPSEAKGGGTQGEFQRPPSSDPEGQELLDKLRKDCGSSRQRDIDE